MLQSLPREEKLKVATDWLVSKDKNSKKLIEAVGKCGFSTIGTPFYVIIKSVIAQQLSSKAASVIENRILQYLGGMQGFLNPKSWIDAPQNDLRSCGISYSKISTIQSVSDAYSKNELNDSFFYSANDQDVTEVLCAFKGIGPWTAEMTLMFALDRWDCFSIGDLGLRKGIEKWFLIPKENKKQIEEFVRKFSPYRTILAWYLWAYFDSEPWR